MSARDETSSGRSSPAASEHGDDSGSGEGKVPPEEQVFYCDLCGNQMLNLHCKLVCKQCGYKRDCSDP